MNKGGFSWKRFLGVSGAKAHISRSTGVPFTRSGRHQKIGRQPRFGPSQIATPFSPVHRGHG
jgi:hypothetical protein